LGVGRSSAAGVQRSSPAQLRHSPIGSLTDE
jgi:hypothetical protein